MVSMTEAEWWHLYAKPFLSAEKRRDALRSSLHIWSLPRQ